MADGAELGSTGGGRKRRRSLRGEVGQTGARFGPPSLRREQDDEAEVGYVPAQPEEPPSPPKPRKARRSLRGEVGQTGARFGSPSVRRALEEEPEPEPDPIEVTAPMASPVEREEPIPEPHYDEPF